MALRGAQRFFAFKIRKVTVFFAFFDIFPCHNLANFALTFWKARFIRSCGELVNECRYSYTRRPI